MTTLDLRPLSPALQKKAIEELNEKPERLAEDITALREWVQKQPHLKSRTTDQFLVAFLRGCKYSLEKAKKKLDTYYTLRTHFPDTFRCFIDEQRTRQIIREGTGLFLPNTLHEDGPRLCLVRVGHYNVEHFTLHDIMQVSVFAQDLNLAYDDNAVVSGFVQLIDFSEFTMAHMLQMNPARMKRVSHYAEEALPMRIRAVHIFNTGPAFETIFATIKPLMPKKVQERVQVHSSMDSLFEQVPQKFFPKEYGGENGEIDELLRRSEEDFMSFRDYLLEEQNYGADEKLRPGKPIDFEAVFGAEGSFRKLDVD